MVTCNRKEITLETVTGLCKEEDVIWDIYISEGPWKKSH